MERQNVVSTDHEEAQHASNTKVVEKSKLAIFPIDLLAVKKLAMRAWEAEVLFFITHNCSVLSTTFGNIPSKSLGFS